MWYLISIILLLLSRPIFARDGYSVKESENSLELKTPFGEKTVPDIAGPQGEDNYKIVIPISDLIPPPPKPLPVLPTVPEKKVSEEKTGRDSDDDGDDDEVKNDSKVADRSPASLPPVVPNPVAIPPKILVEYDDSDQLVLQANWLFNRRRYFEASTVIERLLRKKPDLVRAWIMKGSLLYVQGEKNLAKKAWEQARNLNPEDPEIQGLLERFQ